MALHRTQLYHPRQLHGTQASDLIATFTPVAATNLLAHSKSSMYAAPTHETSYTSTGESLQTPRPHHDAVRLLQLQLNDAYASNSCQAQTCGTPYPQSNPPMQLSARTPLDQEGTFNACFQSCSRCSRRCCCARVIQRLRVACPVWRQTFRMNPIFRGVNSFGILPESPKRELLCNVQVPELLVAVCQLCNLQLLQQVGPSFHISR